MSAALTAVIAYSTVMPWGPVSPLPQSAVDDFVSGIQADANEIADETRTAIPKEVKSNVVVVDGDAAQAILDEVEDEGIIITKRGRPVAKLIPIRAESASLIGSLKNKIQIKGSLSATGIKWNAQS